MSRISARTSRWEWDSGATTEGKVIEAAGGVTDGAVIGLEDRYGIHHSEGLPECKSRKRVRLCISFPENGRETLFSFPCPVVDSRPLGRHMGSSFLCRKALPPVFMQHSSILEQVEKEWTKGRAVTKDTWV